MSTSNVPPDCPMHKKIAHDSALYNDSSKNSSGNGCPIVHSGDALSPDNQMPQLSQKPVLGQRMHLPTDRSISSIPKAKSSENWEYPSPQQFYNALIRKGWETPEESIETMVDIHNFLNEEAWNEILKWEKMKKWYVN